jgi:phosphoglycolate phosphatase-like HAD superfamily hydrolase
MRVADVLKASIKVCMFDQYGTIVDMQAGLTEAAKPYLESKGWKGNPDSIVTWWRRTHFENSMIDALLGREHTSYREIGHRSVAYVLERAGIAYTMDEVRYLVAQIEKLRPFPEVPAALARLKCRYGLAVLSIQTCLKRRSAIMAFLLTILFRLRRQVHSNHTQRPTPRRLSSLAYEWTRCCSLPTMHLIA